MSRRNNALHRCKRCRLHRSLCFCALIPRIETRTRLMLVIHRAEDRKSTNTGRLAAECLVNSEVIVRGRGEHGLGAEEPMKIAFGEGTAPLFLFPHEGATPISEFATSERPITLIVPDGNWRQAAKVKKRVPEFRDLPSVSLAYDAPTAYRLRRETHVEGLATMEAIARAFGALEGGEVRAILEKTMKTMVDRALWARGEVATDDVEGGVPEGVMRHLPASGLALADARKPH